MLLMFSMLNIQVVLTMLAIYANYAVCTYYDDYTDYAVCAYYAGYNHQS